MSDAPHRCGRCTTRWSGATTCHCSNCCVTFGGEAPFLAHRINGKCLNVQASRNFFESRPGIWSHQTLGGGSAHPRAVKVAGNRAGTTVTGHPGGEK